MDTSSRDLPSALLLMRSLMLGHNFCPTLMAVETINMMMMAPIPHLKREYDSNPRPLSSSLK